MKIGKRTVDAASKRAEEYVLWDDALAGFGLRVYPSGRKVYVVQYRLGGGRSGRVRKLTIGPHGAPWTPEQARKRAEEILHQAGMGQDPATAKIAARDDLTVTELCDLYVAEGCAFKKPSTLFTDRGRIERHIKPLLGARRLRDLTRPDIETFMRDLERGKTAADVRTGPRGRARVRGGAGAAARTTGLLGGIFSFAVERGLIAANPATGVRRAPDRRVHRYLTAADMQRLGDALDGYVAEGGNPKSVAIIRLLALTGARKREIEAVTWGEVDLERGQIRRADSKTGPRVIYLSAAAAALIAAQPRQHGSPYVFPADRGAGFHVGTPKAWSAVRKKAGLEDVRLHDFRHTFASVAADAGDSLLMIGKLLGHTRPETTQRYAELTDHPVRLAAQRAADRIVESLADTSRDFRQAHLSPRGP